MYDEVSLEDPPFASTPEFCIAGFAFLEIVDIQSFVSFQCWEKRSLVPKSLYLIVRQSVSHQLYGTEDRHPQIRALAIQHLINFPEHFVEYNTDQSWLQYLQSMSTLRTWADNIIIRAVANTNNLRINITESAQNFSESTTVSSICAESETQRRDLRDIYVGHLEELHYVSTRAIRPTTQSISSEITYQTTSNKPKTISQNSKSNKTSSKETASTKDLEKREQYMREYMKERRKDQLFKKKEIERKKSYNKNYKNSNPEKVKESWQKAAATYRKSNPEKVKESAKESTASYRKLNPQKDKESAVVYAKTRHNNRATLALFLCYFLYPFRYTSTIS